MLLPTNEYCKKSIERAMSMAEYIYHDKE